jgi:hypothetical protein
MADDDFDDIVRGIHLPANVTELDTHRTYHVGDLVEVVPTDYPQGAIVGIYRVKKVPVGSKAYNYVLESVHGLKGVKADAYSMIPFDGSEKDAMTANIPAGVNIDDLKPTPAVGTVVLARNLRGVPYGVPLVVLGNGGKPNTVKIARLGGDNGRFWPSIPKRFITVVEPTWDIIDALLEHGA